MAPQKQETPKTAAPVAVASEKKTEMKEQKAENAAEKKQKQPEKPKIKQEEVVARSVGLPISLKHSMYISTFIKGRTIDEALAELALVSGMKKPIPFKGEIPHRKGNIMAGRYPLSAIKHFVKVIKSLRGNSIVNGFDLDKTIISYSCPSWASRPARRGGVSAKRVNLVLKAKERTEAPKHG